MLFDRLLCECRQLIAIQLGGPRAILLLRVCGRAVVLSKELRRLCIAAHLHLPQLDPCPVRVQIRRAHKRQMHAEVTVHSRAVDANKHAVRNG